MFPLYSPLVSLNSSNEVSFNPPLAKTVNSLFNRASNSISKPFEVAVAAFLDEKIKFTDIYKINETSVKKFVSQKVDNINEVIALDKQARSFAQRLLADFMQTEAVSRQSNI